MRDQTKSTTTRASRTQLPGGFILAALVMATCAGLALADPPADPNAKPPGKEVKLEAQPAGPELPVWTTTERARLGAFTLLANGCPTGTQVFSELAVLMAGEEQRIWTFYDPDVVRKIDPWTLEFVKDRTDQAKDPAHQEQDAYFEMLIFANRTSGAALDREAIHGDDLYAQLFRNPEKYRGDIVHFDGKLKRLRRFDPQAMAEQGGVQDYYEGYMYPANDLREDYPVYIVFTELPPGLKTADQMDESIGFSGYFFKIFRYTAQETNKETKKDRLAPLLIGRTVTLTPAAAAAVELGEKDTNWPVWLGPMFFGLIGLTVGLLFTLGYWYRKGDRHVRVRLYAARHGDFIPPPPDQPAGVRISGSETAAPEQPKPPNRLSEGQSGLPEGKP